MLKLHSVSKYYRFILRIYLQNIVKAMASEDEHVYNSNQYHPIMRNTGEHTDKLSLSSRIS